MTLSVAQATITEGSTGVYTADMLDDELNPISAADLNYLRLTYYNKADNKIINSRSAQDILNANDVTVDVLGNLTWNIQAEDTIIVNSKIIPTTGLEEHVALFEWSWDNPAKTSSKSVSIYIQQTGINNEPYYGTLTGADIYFDGHLFASEWNAATNARKAAALTQATRALDRLNWLWSKTDSSQTLEWPRNGDSDVPEEIIYACYEEASMLLKGFEPEFEHRDVSIIKHKFEAEEQKDTDLAPIHILSGITSAQAWMYLQKYLVDGFQINFVKG